MHRYRNGAKCKTCGELEFYERCCEPCQGCGSKNWEYVVVEITPAWKWWNPNTWFTCTLEEVEDERRDN